MSNTNHCRTEFEAPPNLPPNNIAAASCSPTREHTQRPGPGEGARTHKEPEGCACWVRVEVGEGVMVAVLTDKQDVRRLQSVCLHVYKLRPLSGTGP